MKYIPFFSALFGLIIYFIAGTLFMYFARGARGIEMIPNVNFWKSLPVLIAVIDNHMTCHMISLTPPPSLGRIHVHH